MVLDKKISKVLIMQRLQSCRSLLLPPCLPAALGERFGLLCDLSLNGLDLRNANGRGGLCLDNGPEA